jgi:hypothetical protein
MWILVAEYLAAVFSAAAWPEKGGVGPLGRKADMHAPDKGIKRHEVPVCIGLLVKEEKSEEGKRQPWAGARSLYPAKAAAGLCTRFA